MPDTTGHAPLFVGMRARHHGDMRARPWATGQLWGLGAAAVLAIALTVVAVAGEIAVGSWENPLASVAAVALACVGLSWFAVGAYVAVRRPRHPLGWMFVTVGLLTQVGVAGEIATRAGWVDAAHSPFGIAAEVVNGLTIFLLLGLLPILYPSGRITGGWARALALITIVGAILAQAQVLRARLDPSYTWLFGPPPAAHQPWWDLWLPWLVFGVGVVGGWILCAARLVRARHPERQQLAWLLIAVVAVLLASLLGDSPTAMALQAAALLLLPVAVAVGIVRYQLLGIETIVPRVITAGVLVVLVAAAYLVVMAASGAGLTGEVLPSVIVAAIVAAALLPLHDRLRRLVDRFVYGKAADPLRAVADLGTAVADRRGGDTLEALLVEIAHTFRSSGARIVDRRGMVVAQTGRADAAPVLTAGLAVAGESIGALELAPRARGERYSRADGEMLRAMAGTVALAVRGVALADELEQQRDAVVEASARARDRLQHDLHDGLGPSLTGIRLGLQALTDALADAQADGDLSRSTEITAVLRAEADRAVVEVRRLIDDMRPLDLDDAGLAAALRRRLATGPGLAPVEVRTGDIPSLAPDVEDAVFRIIVEAVANAQKHSGAALIEVTLETHGDSLVVRIADDGRGMPPHAPPGVGLTSMRSRAVGLDGSIDIDTSTAGTTVTLVLPLPPAARSAADLAAAAEPLASADPTSSRPTAREALT